MKYRVGCGIFVVVGLAWLAFVLFELVATTMGDCASPEDACTFYRGYVTGFVFWRGLAVALLLAIAGAAFRYVYKDDDVL